MKHRLPRSAYISKILEKYINREDARATASLIRYTGGIESAS